MGLVRDVRTVADGWRWARRSLTPDSATPWRQPAEPRQFPTAWARSPAARVARRGIQRYGLRPLVWRETRARVEGLDRLGGLRPPVVFVANHASHLDAPLILCSLPPAWADRTAVGAAADYFFDAGWRAAVTALAFNAFPVERQGGPVERQGGRAQRQTATSLLAAGWNLLIFPEGTRSADGWVGAFRQGAARLCVSRGVAAVPVVVRGSYAAMPRGRSWPRPGRLPVSVRFGPPLHPGDEELTAEFGRRVRGELSRLWSEEDDGWYTSLRRQAAGQVEAPSGPEAPRWRRVWESTRPLHSTDRPRAWPRTDRAVR